MGDLEAKVERALALVESGHEILTEHVGNQRTWNEVFLAEQRDTHGAIADLRKADEAVHGLLTEHAHAIAWLKEREGAREQRARGIVRASFGALGAVMLATFSWALSKVWP